MFFGSNRKLKSESRHGYILGSKPNKKIVIPSKKFFLLLPFSPLQPFDNSLIIHVVLVRAVQRVPYLGKERISPSFFIVIPRHGEALGAPVTT